MGPGDEFLTLGRSHSLKFITQALKNAAKRFSCRFFVELLFSHICIETHPHSRSAPHQWSRSAHAPSSWAAIPSKPDAFPQFFPFFVHLLRFNWIQIDTNCNNVARVRFCLDAADSSHIGVLVWWCAFQSDCHIVAGHSLFVHAVMVRGQRWIRKMIVFSSRFICTKRTILLPLTKSGSEPNLQIKNFPATGCAYGCLLSSVSSSLSYYSPVAAWPWPPWASVPFCGCWACVSGQRLAFSQLISFPGPSASPSAAPPSLFSLAISCHAKFAV